MAGAWVDGTTAIFRVSDPGHRLAGVRLSQDVRIPGDQLDFHRDGDGWRLAVGLPPVNRMEYLLELRYPDGGAATVTDPGNPRQAPGAFGPKSVVEFPSYRPPAWLTAQADAGRDETVDVPAAALGDLLPVQTWAPADAPDDNPRYARALTGAVLPALARRLAITARIGMGTSLGGLAMLHAYCRDPDAFDGLFLQSGSFFSPRFDAHERRFPYYQRVVRFVAGVDDGVDDGAQPGTLPDRPVPVVLTCGAIEENVENNRLMEQALRARGYPAELTEVPDMHNYTAWRDAFHPHLTRLVRQVSG